MSAALEPAPSRRPALLALGLTVGAGLALRLVLALGTDLYFDEAYYWVWSQRPAWSYFDHPPLIAWLLAALGPRPAAVLCGVATAGAVYQFAREVHGSREAGLRAAALWCAVPAGALAGAVATPDTPLYLFWILTLWALWRERWGLAGVLAGLALLSKYSAVLLALAFLLSAARCRRLPRGAWLTLLIGAALFSPVVLWNAAQGWEAFGFQLRHGLRAGAGVPWRSVAEFAGGQVLMGGPVLLPLALVWIARGPREQLLLRMASLAPLLVFGLAALRTRGEANWPAPAYLTACIGLAGAAPRLWRQAAIASGLAICAAGALHLVHPVLKVSGDATHGRLQGWSGLQVLGTQGASAVFARSYQLASEAAYYARLPAGIAQPARRTQFDLWGPPHVADGASAIWLSEDQPPPPALAAEYERVEGPVAIPSEFAGRAQHAFIYWKLIGKRPALGSR